MSKTNILLPVAVPGIGTVMSSLTALSFFFCSALTGCPVSSRAITTTAAQAEMSRSLLNLRTE
jgi:hypothetical protein